MNCLFQERNVIGGWLIIFKLKMDKVVHQSWKVIQKVNSL